MSPFPEEQLDSPAGYFAGQPGQTLHNGRWTIIRKLGWGPRSSTWLAVDSNDVDNIEAIKIFTVAATKDGSAKNELNILNQVGDAISDIQEVRAHFDEESSKGKHLCLVFNVLGSSVEELRLRDGTAGGALPVHIVKQVVAKVLESVYELHQREIVHGAIVADNFLFVDAQQADDIREVISKSPTAEVQQITGGDGIAYPVIKSQPLVTAFKWNTSRSEFADSSISLINLSHARKAKQKVALDPSAFPFSSPEVLDGKNANVKSDIWMLGTTVFLLLTGTPLFNEASVSHYEERSGQLEELVKSCNKVAASDIPSTIAFLKACLNVDPSERSTADDLIGIEWVMGGNVCSCGWCAAG